MSVPTDKELEQLCLYAQKRHISTVENHLTIEVGWVGDLGAAGLFDAIVEALKKGGVLDEADVIYLKGEAPDSRLWAVELWVPKEPEVQEPPPIPQGEIEPNV